MAERAVGPRVVAQVERPVVDPPVVALQAAWLVVLQAAWLVVLQAAWLVVLQAAWLVVLQAAWLVALQAARLAVLQVARRRSSLSSLATSSTVIRAGRRFRALRLSSSRCLTTRPSPSLALSSTEACN